jgi:predicted ATPase
MSQTSSVRIEVANEWAWCGPRRLDLTPRAFAVLRHLVQNPGPLITKDELFTTVWRDTIVSDAAVASCIRDLRKALGDSSSAPRYHNALGVVSLYSGDFALALDHLERGIELSGSHEDGPTRSPVFRLVPPGVTCAIHAALALWAMGYPDRSLARAREALARARALDHPFSVSYACHLAAGLHQWRGEPAAMQQLEDEALVHDTEHGFALFLAAGLVQRGWLLAQHGQGEAALEQMLEGLARHREIGDSALIPASLTLIAEVFQKLGRPGEGLAAVTEALTVARQCRQHYWEAELHRMAGVLTLQTRESQDRGDRDAESHFLEAIEIARRQRARSLELRAAMSLSRRWADRGKASLARALLADVYVWFTEGFTTADLREANELLGELVARARV